MKRLSLLFVVLLGCAKTDPLAERRAALAAAAQAPIPAEWGRHASAVLSEQAKDAIVRAAFDRTAGEPIIQDVSAAGMGLKTATRLSEPQVSFEEGSCPDCFLVAGSVKGRTDVRGAMLPISIGWATAVKAMFAFSLRDDPEAGRVLHLQVVEPETVEVDVALLKAPPMVAEPVRQAIQQQVDLLLEQSGVTRGIPLVRLPGGAPSDPFEVRSVRLVPVGEGARVDAHFGVLGGGDIGQLPSIDEGFLGAVTEEGTLAFLDAALLRLPPTRGYTLEARDLRFVEGGFELTVRLWKLAKVNHPYRDYLLKGSIEVEDGSLRLASNEVELAGRHRPMIGLFSGVVQRAVRKRLLQIEADADPAEMLKDLGAGLRVSFDRTELSEDRLILWGSVDY